jgi:hypothetical protein
LQRKKVADQEGNVFGAIAQRGHPDVGCGEAKVEVLTKSALLDFREQISIRRRDDAHVGSNRLEPTETPNLAVLEHAQELGLKLSRQLAELVQEERAVVRQLEKPGARVRCAGEGASFVSEELAFDQGRSDGPAIEDDVRVVGSRARAMNGVRHDVFAGSRFALDEEGDFRGSNPRQIRHERAHER